MVETTLNAVPARTRGLGGYALFAALLSAAGLPIYIHAPKFYVDEFGVSLGALGAVLFALRLLDVVQDPLLGKLAAMTASARRFAVAIGVAVLCIGMTGLFAIPPFFSPVIWFALTLTLVFSAFSFLTISFYAQGVAKADKMHGSGHLRLARWRETGALLGVCAASIAPFLLITVMDAPFTGFAIGFAVLGLCAAALMQAEWSSAAPPKSLGFAVVLQDSQARRLLLIALVNAAPVAVSSTLFLFFVESRLDAPGQEGVLLLLFFLSAAGAAPIWGFWAQKYGIRPVLLTAMVLAVFAFGFAMTLEAGDVAMFTLICIATGAAMGADLTLLPAAFASRMAKIAPNAAEGFGLWAFVSKLSLAFAAVLLLPMLERSGFTSGGVNSDASLWLLTLLYAGVPCALKVLAIGLLSTTKLEEG
ncbi:MFS transporter [Planktotalea arctica]|uniref:MFS transporter n=1 Tax=Planktotalea arctica TaxID=1481893 RepID=UPI000A16CEE0|nr:MFS transporter [Planktotalea arctica]